MRIDPRLVAEIVDALAPRVRKRADALLEAGVELGPTICFGNATVSLADAEVLTTGDQVSCDCLLAPGCAHRAAVALWVPVAEESPVRDAGVADEADPAGTGPEASGSLTGEQRLTIALAREHLAEVLQRGSAHLPATLRSGLAADLHRMRVHGLVTADRALTGFVTSLGGRGAESFPGLAATLVNLHSLLQADASGGVTPELLGRARTAYREVGGLVLRPLAAEPVLAASGFSGVQVMFCDGTGRVWHLSRVRPGGPDDISRQYLAGEPWGGLSEPLRGLSRHTVLVSNATANDVGRLGGGQRVRVALKESGIGWEQVPQDYEVVDGAITGGDRLGLCVGGRDLALTGTARALGAGLATELFGQAVGTRVRCLVRRDAAAPELLGMSVIEGAIEPPAKLGGVWWPGLDAVTRGWVRGQLAAPDPVQEADPASWTIEVPAVTQVTRRWLARTTEAGPVVLSSAALERDVAWLRLAGAPFAADLLAGLALASRQGERRFDGTWQPDSAAYAEAWLRLSQY